MAWGVGREGDSSADICFVPAESIATDSGMFLHKSIICHMAQTPFEMIKYLKYFT